MVRVLFDTNILIDYLNGVDAAKKEIARYRHKFISIITWMEVLAGTNAQDRDVVKQWLFKFNLIALDNQIAEQAVTIRAERRIRLPDAIIWASAQAHALLLVSRNSKDFPADMPGIRMPYRI